MTTSAQISACGQYRYHLTRTWDPKKPALGWVMLNPSTADALKDDPTIRRCVQFSAHNGYGGIEVFNLFNLRATDPREVFTHPDPVGPDAHLLLPRMASMVLVFAWGNSGNYNDRDLIFQDQLKQHTILRNGSPKRTPLCLGVTAHLQPKHPLYVLKDTILRPYDTPIVSPPHPSEL